MGSQEFGKCDICGKEASLDRTYFFYPIHCECCGSKDKNGQDQHFELVCHCKDCIPCIPTEIHPLLQDVFGNKKRISIKDIKPSKIQGIFIDL